MRKQFEQFTFSFIQPSSPVQQIDKVLPAKKPFVQPLLQAVDSNELRSNFMYLLRILINSANRQPNQADAQRAFVKTLLAEMNIKRGLVPLDVETRSAILYTALR